MRAETFAHILRRLCGVLVLFGISATSAAQTEVSVRSGDHPTFSRIVFDFARPPGYGVSLENRQLTIRFDRVLALDFGQLPDDPLDRLADPQVTVSDGATRVVLTATPGTRPRHFFSGSSLVVDAVDPNGPSMSEAPRSSSPSPSPTLPSTPDPEPQAAPADTGSSTPAETSLDGPVKVKAVTGEDGLRLDYAWPEDTEAAVFARAGYLWVVFSGNRIMDHSALDWRPNTPLGRRLGSQDRLEADAHTIVRYRLLEDQHIAVSREGPIWRVELRSRPSFPRNAIEPRRRASPTGADSLFISAERMGAKLRIRDPEVGDMIDIVPLGDTGRAVASERQFAKFRLLATAQGVVLSSNVEDVALHRYANGVAVEGENGLALSTLALAEGLRDVTPTKLLDFAAWRRGGRDEFVENGQSLLVRLSQAGVSERRAARWDLARFYLAHDFAADAHALLELMAETDPTVTDSPEWRAVSGIALLELGRAEEALKTLLAEDLDTETDIWLWRALAAEAAGRHEDALAYFDRGEGVLSRQREPFRARLRLAMARSALARGTLDVAEDQITVLQDMQLASSAAAESDLLYGRLAAARGDMATAAARFEDAAAARDRRISAEARLALTRILLEEGDIDRKEAIARLERLRFAWRGDQVELDMLRLLGGLQVETGQFRKGLEAFRTAATAFSDTPQANAVTRRMSEVFHRLFLDGAADRLSPVEALALFYDFRELTPLGSEGDRMIRHLVDRLVAVDLLDRAAELLRHQVDFRLEGLPRALVAMRLAKIYLLDDRPQMALDTIEASRDRSMPPEVLRERSLIEARTLAELGRTEEALALLEDDRSPAAKQLEADIYWRQQDWPALARLAAEIMDDRWQTEVSLASTERILLMRRALAMSFTDREVELQRLGERYRSLMKGGEFEAMFNLLTSGDPPPHGELARIAGNLANVGQYQAFLSAYRDEFAVEAAASSSTGGPSANAS